jgi:hypothetical protein
MRLNSNVGVAVRPLLSAGLAGVIRGIVLMTAGKKARENARVAIRKSIVLRRPALRRIG